MGIGCQTLIFLTLAMALSGCAGRQTVAGCDQRDWFELGRHDGAQGVTDDQLNKHSRDCRKQIRSDWETMYINGRNAGLVEYCTAENAFELGKMGLAYMFVCPSTVEPQFLSGYRKGQRARELEMENKKLEGKIDNISEKLNTSSNDFEKTRMTTELMQLQARKSQNETELNRNFSKRQ